MLQRRVKAYFEEESERNMNMVRYVVAAASRERQGYKVSAMQYLEQAGFYSVAANLADELGMSERATEYRAKQLEENNRISQRSKEDRKMRRRRRVLWELGYIQC